MNCLFTRKKDIPPYWEIPNSCFFWTLNLAPITGVISLKRCFLQKNRGPHFATKKNSSPNNSNYFIILPNNSNRVSLKLKSSEAKFVWSNLKRVETCYVKSARTKTFFASIEFQNNREKKSLRYVAMVANFLNDNKLETSLKKWILTVSNFINLFQFHLISQMLATFSGGESDMTSSKFRAWAHEIRKFHVAVVQPRAKLLFC